MWDVIVRLAHELTMCGGFFLTDEQRRELILYKNDYPAYFRLQSSRLREVRERLEKLAKEWGMTQG